MNKGDKEYLKHFLIIALLVCATIFFAYFKILSCCLTNLFLLSLVGYMALFVLGLLFNLGPFKYIGKIYVEEAKKKRLSFKIKQPWDP